MAGGVSRICGKLLQLLTVRKPFFARIGVNFRYPLYTTGSAPMKTVRNATFAKRLVIVSDQKIRFFAPVLVLAAFVASLL